MHIEPNSTIKVLRGIPWDNTYQHTPRFASRNAQSTYMNSKVAFTLGKHTYVREGRGYLKVEKNVEELIGCNYLMFQNPKSDGTMGKVFYAFITATEYINPVTTEIRYEIDVMQTWFLDCELGQCFIERSHSVTDNFGDNTVSEDVSVGDYFCSATTNLTGDLDWQLCVITGSYVCGQDDYGTPVNVWEKSDIVAPNGGVPSLLKYNFFPLNQISGEYPDQHIYAWHDALRGLIDSHLDDLLSISIVPRFFYGDNIGFEPNGTTYPKSKNVDVKYNRTKFFEGHGDQIKNNKMFTYPYCCLLLSNNQGQTVQYKYENFKTSPTPYLCRFTIQSDVSGDPTVMAVPYMYEGVLANYDHAIYMTDFPFIGYAGDVYKNWLAVNKNQRGVSYDMANFHGGMALAKGLLGVGTQASKGNVPEAFSAGLNAYDQMKSAQFEVDMMMAKEADMQAKGAPPVGGKGSVLLYTYGNLNIVAREVSIKWEQAKRIDDYFSVYGYAMRCAGIPNITSRPCWNYIKLVNPNITPINGGVPADDVSAIVRILSNGITFWHNANKLGDYSQDNSV